MMNATIALVLAGGRGTRMGVLCQTRPKPMLSYGGMYRVADFTLSNCINSGITDIAVLVDHQRTEMTGYLRRWHAANPRAGSLTVLDPGTGSYAGTGDAVYQNLSYLQRQDAGTVLVAAGDHVYNMDYRGMVAFHREAGADATVAVVRVPIAEAHRFGTVTTHPDGRVAEFVEKSSRPKSDLASMGIYVFDKQSLARYLSEDADNPHSLHDFGYAVLPEVLRKGKLRAYEFHGYWQDIGTVGAYYESQMDLVSEPPRFTCDGSWPIVGERKLGHIRTTTSGNVLNSVISPGCVIEGRVENSVLSPGVRVAKHAEVRNSVVMANSWIGYHSVVDSCILDEGVRIGDLCYIGFGGGLEPGTHRITVLGASVTVPDRTAVGRDCVISPRTGPDGFRGRAIPSGTVVQAPT